MSLLSDLAAAADCAAHPVRCASQSFDAWFQSLPGEWLLVGGLLAGMAIGAWLGWKGVLAIVTLGIGLAVMLRPKPVSTEQQYGEPEVRRKPLGKEIFPGKERKNGETAADRWEARE